MVVVAGVVSLMMLIAVPNYVAIQPGLRLNGAAREVMARLMWARSKAVEQNTRYKVTFPTDETVEIFNDETGALIDTVNIQTNYPGVTFSQSGDDPIFNARGTTNNGTGSTTITLTNSSGSREVTVSMTGNVRIN
jgi:type II secretory pathway pseudopilin PulG